MHVFEMLIQRSSTGRATGKEEDAQGPREEAHLVHPPLRQRHHDWWQEEDEPQPDYLSSPIYNGNFDN